MQIENSFTKMIKCLICFGILFFIGIICASIINNLDLLANGNIDPKIYFEDDSFYYFKVAQNIANTGNCSIDTLNKTNGFHPLWLLMLIPIFKFSLYNLMSYLKIIVVIQSIIYLFCLFLIYRIISNWLEWRAGLFAIIIFIYPLYSRLMLNGLESGIQIFFTTLTIYLILTFRLFEEGREKSLFLGMLFGILMLARLDAIFLIISFCFLMILKLFISDNSLSNSKLFFYQVAYTNIVAILITLPYFTWNYLSFGHLMPISGYVTTDISFKSIINLPDAIINFTKMIDKFIPITTSLILSLFYIFLYIYMKENVRLSNKFTKYFRFIEVMVWLGTGAISHIVYTLLFDKTKGYWHFSIHFIVILFGLPFLFNLFITYNEKNRILRGISFVILIFMVLFVVNKNLKFKQGWKFGANSYKAAIWARDNMEKNAIFGMRDSGIFSFFSQRRVVNLDGVINNYEYQEYLSSGKFSEYVTKNNISYIVSCYFEKKEPIKEYELTGKLKFSAGHRIFGENSGFIYLVKEQEVYRSYVKNVPLIIFSMH